MKKANRHAINRVCEALDVPRSSYYDARQQERRDTSAHTAKLLAVKTIHRETRASYGSRRMSAELRRRGLDIGRFQARRLMQQAGAVADVPKPPAYPKVGGAESHVAPNHLNRQFDVTETGRVLAGDITYVWTAQGWLYLAVVLDLCSRKVVGWALSESPNTELVIRALRLALGSIDKKKTVMFHSDQGCQYTSHAFRDYLSDKHVQQSMSRRGNCWDNAPVERFFRSLKSERIRKQVYRTRQRGKADINDYIARFYNTVRLHTANGGLPPIEFEAQLEKSA